MLAPPMQPTGCCSTHSPCLASRACATPAWSCKLSAARSVPLAPRALQRHPPGPVWKHRRNRRCLQGWAAEKGIRFRRCGQVAQFVYWQHWCGVAHRGVFQTARARPAPTLGGPHMHQAKCRRRAADSHAACPARSLVHSGRRRQLLEDRLAPQRLHGPVS